MSDRIEPRLGDQASEIVTDFEGVVVAITKHLGGEVTVKLQSETPSGEVREFPAARVTVRNPGWAVPSHLQAGS